MNINSAKILRVSVCVIIALSLFTNKASASTVDDLREMLGKAVVNTGDTYKPVYGVVEENKYLRPTNIEDLEDTYNEDIVGSTYNSKLVNLEAQLKACIKRNASAKLIAASIKSIEGLKNKLLENPSISNGIDISGNTSNSLWVAQEGEKADITDIDFTIGSIGTSAIAVAGESKQLITPYGYLKDFEGNFSEKLTGIDLGVAAGSDVKSQWNGRVTNIAVDKETGAGVVTVFHGNGLYTQYSHIDVARGVYVGTDVTQGKTLGKAIDTSSSEPDKQNHMFYQVILDNTYINPLVIYGDTGEKLYNDWGKTTSSTNYVEKGEAYYISSKYKTFSDYMKFDSDVGDVLYPDFNEDIREDAAHDHSED